MTASGGLAEADRLLAEWQQRVTTIEQHLVDLAMHPTLEALEAGESTGWPDYDGVTRERIRAAIGAYTDLVGHLARLREVVAAAAAARAAWNGLWGAEEVARQVRAHLTGPSIALPVRETPLAERQLLQEAKNAPRVTPATLTASMEAAFATVRDLIATIDAAQERITAQVAAGEATAAGILTTAAALGIETGPVATLRADLADLRARGRRDPLGVAAGLATRLAQLEAARQQVNTVEQARATALAARAQAGTTLDRLVAATATPLVTHPARAALPAVVAAATARQAALATLQAELSGWLAEIDERLAARAWTVAARGLERWQATAVEREQAIQAAALANLGPLATAEELAGRVSARLRQVGRYLRAGRPVDPAVTDALREAEQALDGATPAIAHARTRLEAAEAALRALRSPARADATGRPGGASDER